MPIAYVCIHTQRHTQYWDVLSCSLCGYLISVVYLCAFCSVPQVEERMESYLKSYDVVLVKDETMEVPNAILQYLTGSQ